MKKLKAKHKVTPQKKKNPLFARAKKSKGMITAGTVYGLLIFAVLVGGGVMLLGNSTPRVSSPDNNQPVIIQKGDQPNAKDNLQLEDFPGVTITPTPTPTATPTPTPTTPPPSTGGGDGDGGGSTCFIKGTKILMADMTQKNIEEVRAGDKVMGWDGKKNTPEVVLEMEAPVRDHHYIVTLADGTSVGLTNEHPLYTQNGWKSINPEQTKKENPRLTVGKLVIGDKILEKSGSYVPVVSMKFIKGNIQTYNLKRVSGFNNFYANGVLAHNKGGGGSGGGASGGSAI